MILGHEEIKPHNVRYYLERRDAEFEQKMAEVLCVYREVQVLKKAAKSKKSGKSVAVVSYDEKPGIQALATTAPDLPPVPGIHATFARDYEYKRHGTLSLLAGIDLLTGGPCPRQRPSPQPRVHRIPQASRRRLSGRHRDQADPRQSFRPHLERNPSLARRSTGGRFAFTFTPKHGSWLNLIEGFFSKFARSVLRHIRVTSKHELKERIMAGIDDVNRHPAPHMVLQARRGRLI